MRGYIAVPSDTSLSNSCKISSIQTARNFPVLHTQAALRSFGFSAIHRIWAKSSRAPLVKSAYKATVTLSLYLNKTTGRMTR